MIEEWGLTPHSFPLDFTVGRAHDQRLITLITGECNQMNHYPFIANYKTDTVRESTYEEVVLENKHARARLNRDKGYCDPGSPEPKRTPKEIFQSLSPKLAS